MFLSESDCFIRLPLRLSRLSYLEDVDGGQVIYFSPLITLKCVKECLVDPVQISRVRHVVFLLVLSEFVESLFRV